jgi:hypothetical protein
MASVFDRVSEAFNFAPRRTTPRRHPEQSQSRLPLTKSNSSLAVPDELMQYELPTAINEKQHVEHQVKVP